MSIILPICKFFTYSRFFNQKYNYNNNKRLLGNPSNNNHKKNIKNEDIKKRSL